MDTKYNLSITTTGENGDHASTNISSSNPAQLADILQLAGMSGGGHPVALSAPEAPAPEEHGSCDVCGGMHEDEEHVEEGESWDNEPDEIVHSPEEITQTGNDLHKIKKTYPKVNGGDNPMALKEMENKLYQKFQDFIVEEFEDKTIDLISPWKNNITERTLPDQSDAKCGEVVMVPVRKKCPPQIDKPEGWGKPESGKIDFWAAHDQGAEQSGIENPRAQEFLRNYKPKNERPLFTSPLKRESVEENEQLTELTAAEKAKAYRDRMHDIPSRQSQQILNTEKSKRQSSQARAYDDMQGTTSSGVHSTSLPSKTGPEEAHSSTKPDKQWPNTPPPSVLNAPKKVWPNTPPPGRATKHMDPGYGDIEGHGPITDNQGNVMPRPTPKPFPGMPDWWPNLPGKQLPDGRPDDWMPDFPDLPDGRPDNWMPDFPDLPDGRPDDSGRDDGYFPDQPMLPEYDPESEWYNPGWRQEMEERMGLPQGHLLHLVPPSQREKQRKPDWMTRPGDKEGTQNLYQRGKPDWMPQEEWDNATAPQPLPPGGRPDWVPQEDWDRMNKALGDPVPAWQPKREWTTTDFRKFSDMLTSSERANIQKNVGRRKNR